MDFIFCSERGLVRDKNEDSCLAVQRDGYSLFFVADGMGGHKAGEVASKLAIETIRYFPFNIEMDPSGQVLDAILAAHRQICQNQELNEEYKGMGTTISGGILVKNSFYWGHVGDSRIYVLREEELRQITTDHSLVQKLVNENKITSEEARIHPRRNVLLQALGGSLTVDVDRGRLNLNEGDRLFLCTDGVNNMVSDEFIYNLMMDELSLQEKHDKLIQEVIKEGAVDNFTFIMIDV